MELIHSETYRNTLLRIIDVAAVSYTHLDVYKRQSLYRAACFDYEETSNTLYL